MTAVAAPSEPALMSTETPHVTESAFWIEAPSGPLCMRMHAPSEGTARGTVLLCPPIGREAIVAYRTFRELAHELACAGLVALRLDYHGIGDSSGSQSDPGRAQAWLASIVAGVGAARRVTNGPLMVVGMRMGALLAAEALAGLDEPVETLLLWDPCPNGRGWMREQRALQAIGLGATGFGAVRTEYDDEEVAASAVGREHLVDIPSWTFPEHEAQAVSELNIAGTRGGLAHRVVIMTRPGQVLNPAMVGRLEEEQTTWLTAPGQDELIDITPQGARMPVEGIALAAATLSLSVSSARLPVVAPGGPRAPVGTASAEERADVVYEQHVRLGPVGLVGVRTEAPRPLPGAPLMVLIAHSDESHFGPSRAWVELSRLWAVGGISSVRFCVSGLGESPTRPGQSPDIIYAPEALDDVLHAVQAASPDDSANVVLFGLCSGAYGAVEAALTLGVRGVCVLGLLPGIGASGTVDGGRDPRRQAVAPVRSWMKRGSQSHRAWKLANRLPQWGYSIADRLGVLPSPARPLRRLHRAGVDTLCIVGTRDARSYLTFAAAELRRLEKGGRLKFVRVPALDHGMLRGGPREQALDLLDTHVREHFIQPFELAAQP